MEVPDVEQYRPLLEATLAQHAQQPVALIVVPDIAEWSEAHCPNAKGNPSAMAVTDLRTNAWCILVRRQIAAGQVKSVVDRIGWGRIGSVEHSLASPERFLQHLVLHELAHLANGWDQSREDDCDDWAFERLGHAL